MSWASEGQARKELVPVPFCLLSLWACGRDALQGNVWAPLCPPKIVPFTALPWSMPYKPSLKDNQSSLSPFYRRFNRCWQVSSETVLRIVCGQNSPKMPLMHSQVTLQNSFIMPRCLLVLPGAGGSHAGWAAGPGPCVPLCHRCSAAPGCIPSSSVHSPPPSGLPPVMPVGWDMQHLQGFVSANES